LRKMGPSTGLRKTEIMGAFKIATGKEAPTTTYQKLRTPRRSDVIYFGFCIFSPLVSQSNSPLQLLLEQSLTSRHFHLPFCR
jgi:hypothetical protein